MPVSKKSTKDVKKSNAKAPVTKTEEQAPTADAVSKPSKKTTASPKVVKAPAVAKPKNKEDQAVLPAVKSKRIVDPNTRQGNRRRG